MDWLEQYIYNYLDKNYKVKPNIYTNDIIDVFDGKEMNQKKFIEEVLDIFGCDYKFMNLCNEWLVLQRHEILKDLVISLNQCGAVLGQTNWVLVDRTGREVKENEFYSKYGKTLVQEYFQRRLTELAEIYTHKAMGLPPPM